MSGSTIIGNMLILGGGGGSLNLAGSVYSTIAFEPGAAWTLDGTVEDLAGGQTITGFTVGDTIVLESFSDEGGAFTPGTGLVLSTFGGTNITLDITGSFGTGTGGVLQNTTSGGNTTLSVAPIIYTLATSISHGLYLDHPAYGSPFTITSAGTIAARPTDYHDAGLTIGFRAVTVMNMGAIYGATALQPPVFPNVYGSSDGIELVSAINVLIDNSGRITGGQGEAGVYLSELNTLINTGIISGGAGGAIDANGGNGIESFRDLIIDAGTIAGGAAGSGPSATSGYALKIGGSTLVIEPGAVFIGKVGGNGPYNGNNELVLAGSRSGRLDMGGSFSGFDSISFAPGAAWILEGTTAELAASQSITGFGAADTLVLEGFSDKKRKFVSGTGLELGHETIDLIGSFTTADFTVTTDGTNTTITTAGIPCFCAGTCIRTPAGEVAVEDLRAGDLVETAFAGAQRIKWIGRRAYEGRFIAGNHLALPVCIKAGAIAEGVPARDLWVSPGHAIYCDGVLVPAWRLINGVTIAQAEDVALVSYFHIELAEHDVIFAEGCTVESFFDDGCRAQFQNAAAAPESAHYASRCAALVQGGFFLETLRSRIAARAGVSAAPAAAAGALQGYVDIASARLVAGWAQDVLAPDEPVCLDVLAGGRRIGRVLANEYRADLRAAGLGSGCHAFCFVPEAEVEGMIEVRRSVDQAELCWTEAAAAKAA